MCTYVHHSSVHAHILSLRTCLESRAHVLNLSYCPLILGHNVLVCSNYDGAIDYKEFLSLSPGELRLSSAESLLSQAKNDFVQSSYEDCKVVRVCASVFILACFCLWCVPSCACLSSFSG